MRYFMRSLLPRRKAYYRVTIEYNFDSRKEGRHLHLGHYNDDNIDSEDLLKSIRRIIHEELPEQMAKAYNLNVDTHITLETEGSIVVVFSAVFGSILGIYYFVGNYPSFKEGCRVLREDAERLLSRMLERRCKSLTASVQLVSPAVSDLAGREPFVPLVTSNYFWPMIVSLLFNVILGILLLKLVWRALLKVYFWNT